MTERATDDVRHAIPDADLFRSEVAAAQAVSPEERVAAGLELFAAACEVTRAGIRADHPGASAAEVESRLRTRLDRQRRIEEHGIYTYRPMTPEEAGL